MLHFHARKSVKENFNCLRIHNSVLFYCRGVHLGARTSRDPSQLGPHQVCRENAVFWGQHCEDGQTKWAPFWIPQYTQASNSRCRGMAFDIPWQLWSSHGRTWTNIAQCSLLLYGQVCNLSLLETVLYKLPSAPGKQAPCSAHIGWSCFKL